MGKKDIEQSILAGAVKNKVTAGIPTVDAMKRYLRERHEFKNMLAEQAVVDVQKGKESLFAKDGELDPTKDEQMRGRAFSSEEVIRRLQSLNPRLHFERSRAFPHLIGIYIEDPQSDYKGWRHLMGMEAGEVPQYSVRKPDPDGKRMLIEKRGWMKLILDLARLGFVNMEAARKKFEVVDVSHNFAVLTGARQ